MNKTTLIGNLGKDAEVIESMNNGKKYAQFSMATTKTYQGNKFTTWFTCYLHNERLVNSDLVKYLTKGSKIYIEGELTASIWNKQDGTNEVSLTVNVRTIELLGSNRATEETPTASGPPPPTKDAAEDDDLPF